MSLSTDEINILIYKYLEQNGYSHSAFTFGHESLVARSTASAVDIPPGALITLLQKATLYMEMEAKVRTMTVKESENESSDVNDLTIMELLQRTQEDTLKTSLGNFPFTNSYHRTLKVHDGALNKAFYQPNSRNKFCVASAVEPVAQIVTYSYQDETNQSIKIDRSVLLSHASEIVESKLNKNVAAATAISSTAWSPDGTAVATAGNSGVVCIWSGDGKLQYAFAAHTSEIVHLSWSPSGHFLLSCDSSNRLSIWDNKDGEIWAKYTHKACIICAAWRSDTGFAIGDVQGDVHLLSALRASQEVTNASESKGKSAVIKGNIFCEGVLIGHGDEVNVLDWDESRALLASGSDDRTCRIWEVTVNLPTIQESESYSIDAKIKHILQGHSKEVVDAHFSNEHETRPARIATASFDCTVRIWDPLSGSCLRVLPAFVTGPLCMQFSTNGEEIACGGHDHSISVWAVETGALVKRVIASHVITSISWDSSEHQILGACSDGKVIVLSSA